jgi:signal transduction histidine kinase
VAFPVVTAAVRARANQQRRQGAWSGVQMRQAYRPMPAGAATNPWRRFQWVITDPATWLDFAWLLPSSLSGAVLGFTAFALPVYGLEGILFVPILLYSLLDWWGYGVFWPMHNALQAALSLPQGVFILATGLIAGRWLLWLHSAFSRLFLAPTSVQLRQRVDQLTATRADTLDAQAAELRRIERDLHDGAQARLVSLSMSIGLAEELLTRDPAAAGRLLAEARESSTHALAELRGLVRGIHPPVLAERGLAGAVQALAMAVPLTVTVEADLPGRPDAPVESAAYFAIAEVLANVVKHSRADVASIHLNYSGSKLRIVVRDDGSGGADPAHGSGLRGIERRLAAFDGTMTVSSPKGGPTLVTMELPCALSSPRTSPSSATG